MRLGLNTMKAAINFGYWGNGPNQTVEMVKHAESLGYDSVWTSEASGTDAVSPLAFLAAHTTKIKLGTAIMQIAGRSPGTTAMTAVTLDLLSGGRFILGLGVSGPAVVEAWHSQPYGKPIKKSREYIEIVRMIIARQGLVEYHGEHYDVPYMREGSTGLASPIKLMCRPRRPRIPIWLAAMGPRNVRMALETCDGIMPPIYSPSKEAGLFAQYEDDRAEIDAARERNGLKPECEVAPFVPIASGADLQRCRDKMKPAVAFWLGAMGPKENNFYNNLARRFGYEDEALQIRDLYADGRRSEAAAAVPDSMVDEVCLVGPREHIAEQLEAWKASRVTTLILTGPTKEELELIAELVL
ncbi:MAG: LLM class F420-dependent oxidoreductase [Acidimicrobiia bacterium]|nr:LLM class F420-dependent oxidoreductase [Acidimicrobiia bacterium]